MKMRITVDGKTYEVDVEILGEQHAAPAAPSAAAAPQAGATTPRPEVIAPPAQVSSGIEVKSPIAGTVVSIQAKAGDSFNENETLLVLEAMKMESNIVAPTTGTIRQVHVAAGDNVEVGQLLVSFV
jgi:biotin carboxyl carrier protein